MKRSGPAVITLLWGLMLWDVLRPGGALADDATNHAPPAKVTGAIEGVVIFRGEIPKSSTPDDAGRRHELLHVDRANGGLQNMVVYLLMDKTRAQEPASSASVASQAKMPAALIDQRDHQFVPRVLAVRSGQPVTFTNSDPANHNVRTSSSEPANEFNVFTGVEGSYTHHFTSDSRQRPVRLGCDIHPWMRGWIYVFEHPHFVVTDTKGGFRLAAVPPGHYKLALRQPDIRYAEEREVTVSAGEVASLQIEVALPGKSASEE